MRKLMAFAYMFIYILMVGVLVAGCGSQNEDLSKGKEWVKSDKRGRIPKAVARFEAAVEAEPDNAEAHYLLGYYDESASIDRRAEQMVLAYTHDKKKYLEVLIEEALRDRDENVRKSAAKALQGIHKQIDSMIKPLVKTLKSKDSRDRYDAALVLSKLHNRREVVDRLLEQDILKHKRMGTRFDAVRALGDIGDPRAVDALMERITALKTEDEKGEEPEVRRAAVIALRKIARRNIDIAGTSLDIQVEPAGEGVRIAGNVNESVANATGLQKGEIISHIIDNRRIDSLEDYNKLVAEALESSQEITFGLPKIVEVSVSSIDELGIEEEDLVAKAGEGIVLGKFAIESKARKMGLEKGETISHINHQRVDSLEDYRKIVNEATSEGEKLSFTVADEDKYRLLTVSVSRDNRDLGMKVGELPVGAEGVVVTEVRPRSPAVEAGVRREQIISYIVSEKKINGVDEYRQLMNEGLADGEVTISVINRTAINKLIEVLRNKGLIVRFDAARALGEVRDAAAVDSLIEMLQEQANPITIEL